MQDYGDLAARFRRGDQLDDAELRRLHEHAEEAGNYLLVERVVAALGLGVPR